MSAVAPTSWTPPEVAKKLRVSPPKVLRWISRGELRAINVAEKLHGRPRWRIEDTDLQQFLARRQFTLQPKITRHRRRPTNVIEFF